MNEYNIFLCLSIEFLLHQLQSHWQFNWKRIKLYNEENNQENSNEYWNVAVFVVIVVIILPSELSYAFDEIRKKRKAFFFVCFDLDFCCKLHHHSETNANLVAKIWLWTVLSAGD